jgi:thiol-disulfide isomerase/thioredoxin
MAMINDKDKKAVSDRLSKLTGPVKLVMFTQEMECTFCKETHELVEEVSALSDKISIEVKDFLKAEADAKKLGLDKIPAIAVLGEGDKDYGIRFYGIPAGYEFMSLLEAIEIVSKGESGLSASGKERLPDLSLLSPGGGAGLSHGHGVPQSHRFNGGSYRVPPPGQQVPGFRGASHGDRGQPPADGRRLSGSRSPGYNSQRRGLGEGRSPLVLNKRSCRMLPPVFYG